MITIKLNEAEKLLATHLAKARYENARSKGKPDLKMGNQSNWETDLEGIGGEIAACKHFGVYPDTETDLITLPKYDLVTKKGTKIDVKTTKYKNGKLLATLKKSKGECDVYLLVVGTFPEYNLVGWAKDSELLDEKNIVDLGHGKGYALEQHQLKQL